MCEVTPVDQYSLAGAPVNSTNETILNSVPDQPTNFMVQDGATSYDTIYPIDTHDQTPYFNWTGYDEDGDTITTYICIATSQVNLDAGNCDINSTTTTNSDITIFGNLTYNDSSVNYFIRLTPYDGSENGTYLDTNLTLINSIPNTPTSLSPTSTHNQTPDLSWFASDDDTGGIDQWPADSLTYYIRVGTSYGDGTYENNDAADNNSEVVDNPIPWNSTPGTDYANTTVYVSIWTTDGHLNGTSPYYNITMNLYDYLADITLVEMTDLGSYSTCTASVGGCALNPVEGSNTTVAVRVTATDTDDDCDNGDSSANIHLCLVTGATVCDESTNNDFSWELDNISRVGSTCTYTFTINKTASDVTPEFFRLANNSYKLNVNVSSQSGIERTSDTERDRLWEYGLLKAIDYPTNVTFGGGNPSLGQWNDGINLALMTNIGNDILDILWNTSDPTSSTDAWTLNGTDLQIDDDNSFTAEGAPILAVYINATQKTFQPADGLAVCTAYGCDNVAINETMDTYYHAAPPFGLDAGQYNSTILIEIS